MANGHLFFQLKMMRKNLKPPIWRRGLVPANITFAQLALILEEILELPKSANYEFEFYQKKVKFSEWHENMRRGDYYYDFRNAPDHFVNNWLKKEKWFTFRICESGESLPEYRVEIEKEAIDPRFSDSARPVECPVLMVTKKTDDDKFWTSSYPVNDRFQELYHLEKREAEYHYLDELLKEIYEQKKGLGYCSEMVNRDTHTKESAYHAIQNFAKEFKSYSSNISDISLKESMSMDENEAVETYKGPVVKNAVMPRQRSTVEKALLIYTQKELLEDAENLGLQLAGKSKAKIAFEIARYLLDPDHMRGKLLEFSEEELDAFEILIENPFMKPTEEEIDHLEALWDLGYVTVYMDGAYEVPEDAEAVYQVIKRNGYREFHRQAVWILNCLYAFSDLYYVAPVKVLYRMYKRDRALTVPFADFLNLYEKIPEEMNPCCVIDDKIMLSHLAEDGRYKLFDMRQTGTEFYIPTKEEIECLSRDGYPSCVEEYQKLEAFLQNRLEMDEDRCSELCRSAYRMFRSDGEPSDFVKDLEDKKIRFTSRKASEDFNDLLTQAYLHTWKVELLGHTIMEISQPTASVTVSSKATASESSNISFVSDSGEKTVKKTEPVKKIYPNDPCPCGSGKKYKKCCGRK
ncbi:MAG: SEC-C domain-containing protein [Lachnospiraceae bacterium]|nr:SEC-C domain-containing protein [Lachnospiraceae bacterium]